jgi:hypothetical protein
MSTYSNFSSVEEFLKRFFIPWGTPACEDVYSQEKLIAGTTIHFYSGL